MDYGNVPNYDFQDNVYVVSNIKPAAPAAPRFMASPFSAAAISLRHDDQLSAWNALDAASIV
jgi:hypothetical protein